MFNSIQKEIEQHVQNYREQAQDVDPAVVARNSAQTTQVGARPVIDMDTASRACVPGTETVLIHTLNIDVIKGKSTSHPDKDRYYVRHNNRMRTYKSQVHDGDGHLASVITKVVAEDLIATLTTANNRIKTMEHELSTTINERDAYKFTIDTLKQNGAID